MKELGIRVLVALVIVVLIFAIALAVVPSMLLPFFVAAPSCTDARVAIYEGSYSPGDQKVSLLIKNEGGTDLSLQAFITASGGAVTKHPKEIFVSSGGQGTFTLEGIGSRPAEVTVRDQGCRVADLWKF